MGLLEKIDIISPHAFKLFAECPAKFYYKYCEQIPTPQIDKGFITGKNIHAMASYLLKGFDTTKFEDALTEKEKSLWLKLKNKKYFQYEIIGVEKSISCKTGNYWIGGRIDAIVKDDDFYYILDYKTGGVSDNMTYDYQTVVYLLACDALLKDYKKLSFVYLDLKNNKEVIIDFSDDLKAEYSKRIENKCTEIDKFSIEKFSKCDLTNCEYLKICKPSL